jgi:hypothetical protein
MTINTSRRSFVICAMLTSSSVPPEYPLSELQSEANSDLDLAFA